MRARLYLNKGLIERVIRAVEFLYSNDYIDDSGYVKHAKNVYVPWSNNNPYLSWGESKLIRKLIVKIGDNDNNFALYDARKTAWILPETLQDFENKIWNAWAIYGAICLES